MIAYFKCLCRAQDKLLAKELREQGAEIRLIQRNAEWRKEANSYGLKLPILVDGNKASSLWTS